MTLRRGFEVSEGENILICEDIITTSGSALEAAKAVQKQGANITGFAALASRGFCKGDGSDKEIKLECKLPKDLPFFALDDFVFEIYESDNCPLCVNGSIAYKLGSR